MPDNLAPDLRRFIDQQIESVAQLEVLLLLQAHADRDWSAAEVAKTLYTAADMCGLILTELTRRRLAVVTATSPEPRYRYHPEPPEIDSLVCQLAQLYQDRRVTVITCIYAKPVDRVRTFADAFRLRGNDP